MSNIKIEPTKLENLEEIMALELLGFHSGIIERKDVFLERIKVFPEGFLIAREAVRGRAIGYISSEIWIRHELIEDAMFTLNHGIETTHNYSGTEIYISSMTIHPDYRGKGIGRLLFSSCINNLINLNPRICSAILIMNETWEHAKQIYVTEGFVELFRIKDFFTPDGVLPQSAIVMRREITGALV